MSETTNNLDPSEVAYNLAKARKVTAEAQSAEYLAEGHFYGIEEARRNALQLTISNDHLRVLRFSAAVTPGAVDTAIARLTKWHREDNLGDVRLPIEIIFTSPGGSIIDGLRLYDFIRRSATPVTMSPPEPTAWPPPWLVYSSRPGTSAMHPGTPGS